MSFTPEQQVNRFINFLDNRRYEDMLSLMWPDASWLRQNKMLQGHEEILKVLSGRGSGMRVRHVVSNVVRAEAGEALDKCWDICWDICPKERLALRSPDDIFLSYYLTAYRFDDEHNTAAPWVISGPHKFSLVHARFVQSEDQWLIGDMLMLAEFVFEESHSRDTRLPKDAVPSP